MGCLLMKQTLLALTGVALCAMATGLAAQTVPGTTAAPPKSQRPPAADSDEGEIEVIGRRLPGAVISDIPPEVQLTPADIRSFGVSSVSELLDELAPQTNSGQGRGGEAPVVLLNGRRISGMAEIRDIPTEAIRRVDILPEEVALKYGYRPDQKVVNFVLRPRFRAATGELEGGTSTEGGRDAKEANLFLLKIQGDNRINVGIRYQDADKLEESQRDIISSAQGASQTNAADAARYRSLAPATSNLAVNAVLSRPVFGNVQATLNANAGRTTSDSDLGLPPASLTLPAGGYDVRGQRTIGNSQHLGFTLNDQIGQWRWTATGNYDRAETRTRTDRGFDVSQARSISNIGNLQFVAAGPLIAVPAGSLTTSIKVGAEASGFDARSTRSGVTTPGSVSRNIGSGQLSFDLPLASTRNNVLAAIGDLSANLNLAADRVSHFGTLKTIGYGVNWRPRTGINLIWSMTDDHGAPTVQQLGNPQVTTPDVRIFDFASGQTVDITRISGGNPGLLADHRHVMKIGLTVKPLAKTDLTITATYIDSRTRNLAAAFPVAIAQIETAFPDRFTRDADGNLVSIDSRPIQYQREDRQQLRWGINFSRPLRTKAQAAFEAIRAARRAAAERGEVPPGLPEGTPPGQTPGGDQPAPRNGFAGGGGEGQAQGQGPGRGFGGPGGGRGFGGGGGGFGGGRLQFAVYHTWYFKDAILIRDGLPVLDLLGGSATGSNGGQPRHVIDVQAGYTKGWLGSRLSATWQAGTTVRGGAALSGSSGDLNFSPLTTINLRVFANLAQAPGLMRDHPWVRGMRISFNVNNLLDQRVKVRDNGGLTPLSYQPGYVDPVGRTVRIGIRKLFF
ncbi:TonB dependent receptor [Sphingomonas sp. YR710]|nr:TonB dependent receptor [Sphingomonas sp. YR710]